MKKIFMLLALVILSCSINKTSIKGTYLKCNNHNLKDTLVLNVDGTYHRKIYSNSNKLVFENVSSWTLKENRIVLKDFLKDEDDISYTEIEEVFSKKMYGQYQKFLMTVSLPLKREENTIFISIDQDLNAYYKKIK